MRRAIVDPAASRSDMGRPPTTALLRCGLVAAPVFSGVVLLQALTRPGYDLARMPLSLLALGPFGWIQTVNFLVGGALVMACALGVSRALASRSGAAASILLLLYGGGLAAAGVFPADPLPGAAPTASHRPADMSWHADLHGLAFAVAQLGLTLGCAVLAVWFARHGRRGLAGLSAAAAVLTPALVFVGFSSPSIIGLAFFLTAVVGMGWLALVAWALTPRSDA